MIRNLLSFGPKTDELKLEPLNVFIGPNGSGKSNIIEIISMIRSSPRNLSIPIQEGGGIMDWLWKGADSSPTATIELITNYQEGPFPLRHKISFMESSHKLNLTDERIENEKPVSREQRPYFFYKFERNHPILNTRESGERKLKWENIKSDQSILSQRKDPEQYPELSYLGDVYESIRLYREWSFGRYTAPRMPQKADMENVFLNEDCGNLGLVLNRLRRKPDVKNKLLESLNTLYEGIDDFDVIIEAGTVQVFFQEGRFTIPATRLSDGTLRYLCLLTILLHPEPPPLICIEEPELGLHPDIIPTIAKLLKEASERTQLIVTTHSDILVDELTDLPESVVVCDRRSNETHMERLDSNKLKSWLEGYRLGELWTSGEIGGNRW